MQQAATTHKEHTDYLFEHSIDSLVFFSLKSHYRNICVGKIVITMHYQIMRLSSEKEIITSIGISDIVPCWNPDSTNVFFMYRFMADWTVIGQKKSYICREDTPALKLEIKNILSKDINLDHLI